jgi:hypothetical protein
MTAGGQQVLRVTSLAVAGSCMAFALVMTLTHLGAHSAQEFGLLIPFTALLVVSAIVTTQRPEAPIGWALLAISVATGLNVFAGVTGAIAAVSGARGPLVTLTTVACNWTWPVTIPLLVTFLPLLFPDGLPSRRWRPIGWLAAAATAAAAVAAVAVTSIFVQGPDLPTAVGSCPAGQIANDGQCGFYVTNPIGFLTPSQSDAVMGACITVALVISVAAIVSLVRRTRRSTGVLRVQMRWVTPALVAVPLSFVVGGLVQVPGASSSFNPLAVLALTAFFGAMGVSITRYHLYDIDRIVSRTTAYAIVTALVVGVFALIVLGASHLLHTRSNLAVAAATLAAAAVFQPLLRRVQSAVDRQFNRARYSAGRTLDSFGRRLRDEIAPDVVQQDLLAVVNQTIEPSSVSLWVRP